MTLLETLQRAVEVEHEVVYGYGVAGARLIGGQRRLALEALRAHQQRRDDLTTLVAAAGGTAAAPAVAYSTPPLTGPPDALALLARLEDGAAGAAWDLAAASPAAGATRRLAVAWMSTAAMARWQWQVFAGGDIAPPVLPGQPS